MFRVFSFFIVALATWLSAADTAVGQLVPVHPVDAATEVLPLGCLEWFDEPDALSYNVYLGGDASAVAAAGEPSELLVGQVSESKIELVEGMLDLGGMYFWRVDSVRQGETVRGDTWSFTVAPLRLSRSEVSYYSFAGSAAPRLTIDVLEGDLGNNFRVSSGFTGIAVSVDESGDRTRVSIEPLRIVRPAEHVNTIDFVSDEFSFSIPLRVTVVEMAVTSMLTDLDRPSVYALQPGDGESSGAILISVNTETEQVEGVLPVGVNPTDMTISREDQRMYIANSGQGHAQVVDLQNFTLLPPLPIPEYTVYINAGASGSVFVAGERGEGNIHAVDTATGAIRPALQPTAAAGDGEFSPDKRYYYNAPYNQSYLQRWDLSTPTPTLVAQTLSRSFRPTVLVSGDGSRVFLDRIVMNSSLSELGAHFQLLAITCVSPDGRFAFGSGSMMDNDSGQLVSQLPVETSAMATSADGSKLFLFDPRENEIIAVALSDLTDIPEPSPFDGEQLAAEDTLQPEFRWPPVDGAVAYNIYLGEEASLNTGHLVGTTESLSFTPDSSLDPGKRYFWRIDAIMPSDSVIRGETVAFSVAFPLSHMFVERNNSARIASSAASDRTAVLTLADSNRGQIRIFTREPLTDTWTEGGVMMSSYGLGAGQFGNAVAVSDDFVLVSSFASEVGPMIEVFTEIDGRWQYSNSILAPEGAVGFGGRLHLDDHQLLVAARSTDYVELGGGVTEDAGAIYVFEIGSWKLTQKLFSPTPRRQAIFGEGLAAAGDVLLASENGPELFAFKRDPSTMVWNFAQEFSRPRSSSGYSQSFATDGSRIALGDSYTGNLVSLYEEDGGGLWRGAPTEIRSPYVLSGDDRFGSGVKFGAGQLFVGSSRERFSDQRARYTGFAVDAGLEPSVPIDSPFPYFRMGLALSGIAGNHLVMHGTEYPQHGLALYKVAKDAPTAPVFTSLPPEEAAVGTPYVYQITTLDENAGDTVEFKATGRPGWLTLIQGAEAGGATLVGTPPPGSAGEFSIRVRANDSGGRSRLQMISLTVFEGATPPAFSQPFADREIFVHQSLVLTAPASGTGTVSYQWFFNGEPIGGATGSRLHLDPARAEDAGSYHVVATNAVGSTTGESFVVSVGSDDRIGGDWSTFGKRTERTGYYPATLRDHSFVPVWSTEITDTALKPPSSGGGNFYVTPDISFRGESPASAIDIVTGQIRWTHLFEQANSYSIPSYYEGRLFIRKNDRDDSQLWTFDATTGEVIWQAPFESGVGSWFAPAVTSAGIFLAAGNEGLYKFDHSGAEMFRLDRFPQTEGWTPSLTSDGRMFVYTGGTFSQVDTTAGFFIWTNQSAGTHFRNEGTVPAISGSRAVILSPTHVHCFDLDAGVLLWSREQALDGSPAIAAGVIYATDASSIHTFSLETGESLGQYLAPEGVDILPDQPIVMEDVVIQGGAEQTLVYDLTSRALLQEIPFPGHLAFTDGYLAIAGGDGVLRAYYANRMPRLSGAVTASVDEDSPYSTSLSLEEDDAEAITVRGLDLPEFLTLTQEGDTLRLDGVPLAEHVGRHDFSIEVTDAAGLSATRDFSMEVIFVDDAPTTSGIDTMIVAEDSGRHSVELPSFFDDEESGGAGLEYTIVDDGAGGESEIELVDFRVQAGVLDFESAPDSFGEKKITIRATDPSGQAVEAEFILIVTPVDDRPQFSPIDGLTAEGDGADAALTLAGYFSDGDPGDTLTFSIEGNSNSEIFSSLGIDPDTGQLRVSFAPYVSGQSTIMIRATDSTGLAVDAPMVIILPAVPMPDLGSGGAIKLNRQTGLYEQTVTVTNSGERAVGGFQLSIIGLPDGATVYNASGGTGEPAWIVTHARPVTARESLDLVLEYYVPGRASEFSPELSATHVFPIDTGATSNPDPRLRIDRILMLDDQRLLIEFPSEPGTCYQIQYSSDNQSWHDSLSRLRASGTRTQWIDQGAPRTPSLPGSAGVRFYRVVVKEAD